MPKRLRKPRMPDPSELAFAIVQRVTGQPPLPPAVEPLPNGKNPAAVALGKLGGAKGGLARAAKMTKKQRSDAAKRAAKARWGKIK